jgi:GTPase involved in cell partitioning and DNA repair
MLTDIAGLVKGASEGRGLGTAFLSHVAAVDGLFHVVRAFDDESIIRVDDSVDPIRDLATITGELCAKDLRLGPLLTTKPIIYRGLVLNDCELLIAQSSSKRSGQRSRGTRRPASALTRQRPSLAILPAHCSHHRADALEARSSRAL